MKRLLLVGLMAAALSVGVEAKDKKPHELSKKELRVLVAQHELAFRELSNILDAYDTAFQFVIERLRGLEISVDDLERRRSGIKTGIEHVLDERGREANEEQK